MATLKQNSEALKALTNKLKNLPKRAVLTDLVVTKNGDYTPEDENSGFKRVSVEVPSEIDALIDGTLTELNSGATSIRYYAFGWSEITSANIPNATSIGKQAFYYCRKLTSANIPNATSIGQEAFYYCDKLTSVNVPNVTSIDSRAFSYCTKLGRVELPLVTRIKDTTFGNCAALTHVNFPKVKTVDSSSFQDCAGLMSADFPSATSIGGHAFNRCYSLKAVILRSETMCTLYNTYAFNGCYHILGTINSTYNPDGLKDGYIYVPRALLSDTDETKDYRRATNWAEFATQFRALEDYTVDGTITGELDPNKI